MGDWITGLGITHLLQPPANAILAGEDGTRLPKGMGQPGAWERGRAPARCRWRQPDLPTLTGLGSALHPTGACFGSPLQLQTRYLGWLSKILPKPICSILRITPLPLFAAAELGEKPPKFPTHPKRSARDQRKTRRGWEPSGALPVLTGSPAGQGRLHPCGGIYPKPRKVSGSARGLSPTAQRLPAALGPSSPAAAPRFSRAERGRANRASKPEFHRF